MPLELNLTLDGRTTSRRTCARLSKDVFARYSENRLKLFLSFLKAIRENERPVAYYSRY